MRDEVLEVLNRIGGAELADSWVKERESVKVAALPTASLDGVSVGYAVAIGAFAAAVDHVLDAAFREEMKETHRKRTPEEQVELEQRVKDVMKEEGIKPGGEPGDPDTGMDWYRELNDVLDPDIRLRPSNHRILNHTDEESVIEMLMKGEGGLGKYKVKKWPEMTREAAKRLYDAHIAADRGTAQSLPLSFMSWFWEQGMKAANPAKLGEPNALYSLLSEYLPDVDWAKWLNKLFGTEGLIPDGATLGDAMIKLYDAGVLNERVFWTSNLGAAWGGAKRRAIIAGLMELGVEFYALVEGARLGHIDLRADLKTMGRQVLDWRDQPKYMDMRITAQIAASADGIIKANLKGDILSLNFFSLGLTVRHLWVSPRVMERHTQRLVKFSSDQTDDMVARFTERTGIIIPRGVHRLTGESDMVKSLDDRLHAAGCYSTRVRVLASRYPDKVEPLVELYERWATRASEDMEFQPRFDALCESWYLSHEEDDDQALALLRHDLRRLMDSRRFD